MSANSRFASAVHILTFLAYAGPEGSTSISIAKSLRTNPVVVRTFLKELEIEGLVSLRRGRLGGVSLARSPDQIDLGQIYRAIEGETGLLSMRETINPRCIVSRTMMATLPGVFSTANDAVETALKQTSLRSLLPG
jgi:Rrf2 family protein